MFNLRCNAADVPSQRMSEMTMPAITSPYQVAACRQFEITSRSTTQAIWHLCTGSLPRSLHGVLKPAAAIILMALAVTACSSAMSPSATTTPSESAAVASPSTGLGAFPPIPADELPEDLAARLQQEAATALACSRAGSIANQPTTPTVYLPSCYY